MNRILILLSFLGLVVSVQAAFAAPITYDKGIPHYFTGGLTGYATTGAMMEGMEVSATFSSGSESSIWGGTAGSSGGAFGNGWSLTQKGDTFNKAWTFSSEVTITKLLIDAGLGDAVFDVDKDSFGTEGSARGWAFDTSYDGHLEATYRGLLGLTQSDSPHGDLYRYLELDFGNVGFSGTLSFIADTDSMVLSQSFEPEIQSADSSDDKHTPAPVPEPGTLALLGVGFAILGIAASRRKKTK